MVSMDINNRDRNGGDTTVYSGLEESPNLLVVLIAVLLPLLLQLGRMFKGRVAMTQLNM